jgi:phosphate transport system protein
MSRLLDAGLEELAAKLLRMGEVAEQTITLSVEGFLKGADTSERVHSLSEVLMAMNVDIEDKAFELTARYQPVASDLRIIRSYVKIAYDLERYGRYAWDISSDHKIIAHQEKCAYSWTFMEELAEKVVQMVHTSVDALKNHDAELAKTLGQIEKEVDEIYFKCLNHLVTASPTTKCLISSALVARYLERIADHATYVGESVVYIATGEKIILR